MSEALEERLRANGREPWLADEMAVLTDPATYVVAPEDAWRRLKLRNPKPRTWRFCANWPPYARTRRAAATAA